MADLQSAALGYQGNVAAMSAIKSMISQSIDLLK
jgi:flagellar basal body rod protein FlgC